MLIRILAGWKFLTYPTDAGRMSILRPYDARRISTALTKEVDKISIQCHMDSAKISLINPLGYLQDVKHVPQDTDRRLLDCLRMQTGYPSTESRMLAGHQVTNSSEVHKTSPTCCTNDGSPKNTVHPLRVPESRFITKPFVILQSYRSEYPYTTTISASLVL